MTKKELIDHLEHLADYVKYSEDAPALREAIEMLRCSEIPNSSDAINRQMAIDALDKRFDSIPMEQTTEILQLRKDLRELPSAQPKIIHCLECIYYDPEHIENDGVRYEYKDMPKDAFDTLGTGLVNLEYGINVGGRCCRDYNVGYSEDKRVFVSKQNYCGRAERRIDE